MTSESKIRLDTLVARRGLTESREKARALISSGQIRHLETILDKPGLLVPADLDISCRNPDPFVSRGGQKLDGFLKSISFNPTGFRCLDIGSSTGGFTDCLLQRGAAHITCVDVGKGILHWKCRNDSRVHVMEQTNARYLDAETLGRDFDLIVADVSFISLTLILPPAVPCLKEGGALIALVKPQFEAGRREVGKHGVVRSQEVQEACLQKIMQAGCDLGLSPLQHAPSALKGPKGNQEYFILFRKSIHENCESL